jgi:acyl-homoserine lactone acylase PvdQ
VRRRLALAAAVAALAALPATAHARIVQAEDVLPPGQSGFVSVPGVASGTGSPHLSDQMSLYTSFRFKSEMFNDAGTASSPRAGVEIARDGCGVPSVSGSTDYDAWWGVGYAVAQDRLFQLELFKRAASGRLAEILGPDYLDDDLIARRDYYTTPEIEAMGRRMPARLYQRVLAYRDGINAWIAKVRSDPSQMPGEFVALGVPLTDWTADDSLRIGVLLARTIPSGDGMELDNARALKAIGPKAFSKILPLRTPGRVVTVPRKNGLFPSQPGRTRKQERSSYKRSQRFVKSLPLPPRQPSASAAGLHLPIHTGGSYMWAVRAPHHKAYLFNGPQLGFSEPELFVEFEVHSPTERVRGVSAAGVPIVGIGHNANVAWGFTSGLSDEDDLYAEQLTGPETYRYKGQVHRMDCRNETFQYRTPPTDLPGTLGQVLSQLPGGHLPTPTGSKTERICRSVHGPVQERADNRAFARRYAIWGRELETIVGLSALDDAKNVRGVDSAMRKVTWNENVIAADSRGDIGYWHPGLHPLRPKNYDERFPYPGTGQAEWRGLLPRKKTPHVIDPKQGYLFNWNNMPSVGWTNGDNPARERASGKYHRSAWLRREVRALHRHPSYARHRGIDRTNGTIAQQRPLFSARLKKARRHAHGRARAVLAELVRWNGSYNDADSHNKVAPGVAVWEQFKGEAEAVAFHPFGPGAFLLSDGASLSHQFDIKSGEAYALRTLSLKGLSRAATLTDQVLTKRFGTNIIAAWREPRRQYEIQAQGAASPPDLPFFDRGTWEQSVAVGP